MYKRQDERAVNVLRTLKNAGFEAFIVGGAVRDLMPVSYTHLDVYKRQILATLAGFLEFSVTSGHVSALVMVAVVYGFGQAIESFFLTPRLVGERIGLHPLAVIFALLAFGQLLGFVGVLIALPLSAVLLVAIRRIRVAYLGSALYNDCLLYTSRCV